MVRLIAWLPRSNDAADATAQRGAGTFLGMRPRSGMQAPQGAVAGALALADPRFAGPLVPRSGARLQGGARAESLPRKRLYESGLPLAGAKAGA